jgi:flagellar hook-length control protein FliK
MKTGAPGDADFQDMLKAAAQRSPSASADETVTKPSAGESEAGDAKDSAAPAPLGGDAAAADDSLDAEAPAEPQAPDAQQPASSESGDDANAPAVEILPTALATQGHALLQPTEPPRPESAAGPALESAKRKAVPAETATEIKPAASAAGVSQLRANTPTAQAAANAPLPAQAAKPQSADGAAPIAPSIKSDAETSVVSRPSTEATQQPPAATITNASIDAEPQPAPSESALPAPREAAPIPAGRDASAPVDGAVATTSPAAGAASRASSVNRVQRPTSPPSPQSHTAQPSPSPTMASATPKQGAQKDRPVSAPQAPGAGLPTPSQAEPAAPAVARAAQIDLAVQAENATGQPASTEAQPAGPARVEPSPRLAPQDAAVAIRQQLPEEGAETGRASGTIVRGLHALVNQRGGAMTMRLDPPELGQLRVEMVLSRGVVSAEFQASTQQAQALLDRSMSALRSALEGHGLTVDRLTVHSSAASQQGQQGTTSDDSHDQRPGHSRSQHDAADQQSRGRRDGEEERRDSRDPHRPGDFSRRLREFDLGVGRARHVAGTSRS